jgi:autotransporter-associated beta strand protein
MGSLQRLRTRCTFEPLEARNLLGGGGISSGNTPLDDSGLAPPGLAATCALPNLPVYDVKDYGAAGNGVTDDTVAIRSALSAAEAAGGGIIYLPAGTYAVCPQSSDLTNPLYYASPIYGGNLPIFAITTSNIVFMGDGVGSTHLEGYSLGMKDPVTNWYSPSPGGVVCRFDMFFVWASVPISTIQFRSMDVCGNAGWTGNYDWPADPVTGDGWDLTNKCISLWDEPIDQVLVFNCALHDFRGEIIYGADSGSGQLSIINSNLYGSNGDAVSCSADVLMSHDTLGGDAPGMDLTNGVENFDMGGPERTVIEDCSISSSSSASNLHGNGVAYLGLPSSSLTVERTTFSDNQAGLLFGEFAYNVTVANCTFSNNQVGMIDSILGNYPTYAAYEGFGNFTITGNQFNNSGDAFISQAYSGGGYPPFTNFVMEGNTVTNGTLLAGAFWSTAPDTWTGFTVSNNTLGIGAYDTDGFEYGDNFALWTNTTRLGDNSKYPVTDSSSETTTTLSESPYPWLGAVFPSTDQTVLGGNENAGASQYIELDTSSMPWGYPAGFQTDFVNGPDSPGNWVLKADPQWNTFPSDEPVGSNGLWIQVNSQGLFTLMPALSGIEDTPLAYTGGGPVAVTAALAASDPNSATLAGATVQISGNYQSGEDLLSFANTANITASWNAATGTLTLSGVDTVADYEAALQSVYYVDMNPNPSTVTRTVTFQVNDGQLNSNVVSRQIAVSNPAVIAGIEPGPLAYTAGDPSAPLAATLTVSDSASTTLAGATIQISGNYRNGEDVLSFSNTPAITGSWDATSGTLTLAGIDTLADYEAALQTVTYQDTSSNPSSAMRTVSFQVNDGLADSNVVTRQITVTPAESAPVLAGIEAVPIVYTQGDLGTTVSAALTASDSGAMLIGATIWISGNYQSGEDVLAFTNTANITGAWNAAAGTLTLSGLDTAAHYQAALQSVTYCDTNPDPDLATRIVSFQVNDCLAESNIAAREISFAPVAIWSGSPSGVLSNPANWVSGVAPNPALDNLILGGTSNSSPVNDFPSGSEFNSLSLEGACTLSGNAVLLGSTLSNVSGDNSVTVPLVFGNDGLLEVASGSLSVGGTIAKGGDLTVDAAAGSSATVSAIISGSGGLVKNGPGVLTLSGANNYSGATVVSSGKLVISTPDGLPSGGNLFVGSDGSSAFGGTGSGVTFESTVSVAASPGATPVRAAAVSGNGAAGNSIDMASDSAMIERFLLTAATLAGSKCLLAVAADERSLFPADDSAPAPTANATLATLTSLAGGSLARGGEDAGATIAGRPGLARQSATGDYAWWEGAKQKSTSQDDPILIRDLVLAEFGRG